MADEDSDPIETRVSQLRQALRETLLDNSGSLREGMVDDWELDKLVDEILAAIKPWMATT